jgi:hypothetical protein
MNWKECRKKHHSPVSSITPAFVSRDHGKSQRVCQDSVVQARSELGNLPNTYSATLGDKEYFCVVTQLAFISVRDMKDQFKIPSDTQNVTIEL